MALFEKSADIGELKQTAMAALVEKFGEDKSKWPCPPEKMKTPFRDQGDREKDGKLPQGYEKGAIYLNLKSNQKPGLVDSNVQPILDQSEFYGGCWARATVQAYAYDQKGNRGVGFGLLNIQKLKDDTAFGSKVKAEDDFEAVDVGEGDDMSAVNSSDIFS